MRKLFSAFLAVAVFSTITSNSIAVADTAHYEAINCSNGFTSAYVMTIIGDYGCVLEVHGVNCWGFKYSFRGARAPRAGDLGLSYDVYQTGTISGLTWYSKIQLDGDGVVAKAWGRQTDGSYYEIVP